MLQPAISISAHTHTLTNIRKRALIVYRLVSALGVATVSMCVCVSGVNNQPSGQEENALPVWPPVWQKCHATWAHLPTRRSLGWLITFHRVMATDANRLNLSYFWARFVLLSVYLVWNAQAAFGYDLYLAHHFTNRMPNLSIFTYYIRGCKYFIFFTTICVGLSSLSALLLAVVSLPVTLTLSLSLSLCFFVALSIDLNLALHYASRNSGLSIIQNGNSGHINQANLK